MQQTQYGAIYHEATADFYIVNGTVTELKWGGDIVALSALIKPPPGVVKSKNQKLIVMTKKPIGEVTPSERDEIRSLFERKNGLTELFQTVDSSNEKLYNKVISDMGKTSAKFQKWWDDKAQLYNWENIEGGSWEIDFENCAIYLVCK